MTARALVVAQFALLAAAGLAPVWGPGWPQPGAVVRWVAAVAALLAGLALTIGGIAALGRSLTPLPDPRPGAELVSGGVYERVRHPIYGGLMLLAFGWSLLVSPAALVPAALLSLVLWQKSRLEERRLAERFPAYVDYRRRTPLRFVPGIL